MRLVGSGAASPGSVKKAAFLAFGLAAIAGLVLAATTAWWLVALGAVSILAAWFYTGGSKPYGYLGLGEVMVFCFFGLAAVLGTVFVQWHSHTAYFDFTAGGRLPADFAVHHDWRGCLSLPAGATVDGCVRISPWPAAWFAAVGIGAIACAILVANNLRDIPTDAESGKMTLAVRLGDRRTRIFYAVLVLVAVLALVGVALASSFAALVALVAFIPLGRGTSTVLRGANGPGLIPVLQATGVGELLYGAGIFIGLLVAR
jgi:1,4-dihydroxy-2-naphthoate octaprenyltransferase